MRRPRRPVPAAVLSLALGARARARARPRPDAGLPARLSRRRGGLRASSPAATPTWACSSATRESPVSAARFTATRHAGGAGARQPGALPAGRPARGARQLGLRQRRHRPAGARRRGQDARAPRRWRSEWTPPRSRSPPPAASATTCPWTRSSRGILEARPRLSGDGDGRSSRRSRPPTRSEKRASLEVELPSGTVRLSAQCKGAGMISPRFATMLCFVETDAALLAETADLLLGVCVKRSFDRASVDGQLSTNDTAILICSGDERRRDRPRERGRAALRRGARRAPAPAGDHDGRRRRGREADRARARARRRPPTASRRPRARSPTRRS